MQRLNTPTFRRKQYIYVIFYILEIILVQIKHFNYRIIRLRFVTDCQNFHDRSNIFLIIISCILYKHSLKITQIYICKTNREIINILQIKCPQFYCLYNFSRIKETALRFFKNFINNFLLHF